ncbi:MAG: alpha-E domain-containing protein, partial [Verrucomicrobiae bacterium]|nr:alpha-E domain-containing protein [Verrucomicrobiae bacterium]
MLSRVADSLYWLSRYLERAENLARMVDVCRYDALDAVLGDSGETWRPILYAMCSEEAYQVARRSRSEELDVGRFITFADENPDCIRHCIAHARENARMV